MIPPAEQELPKATTNPGSDPNLSISNKRATKAHEGTEFKENIDPPPFKHI